MSKTKLSEVELLFGHADEGTALVVPDYPYGRRVRTTIRYWIETVANKGDRFCSQTMNPRTALWNKPKKSTYCPIGIMFRSPGASEAELAELADYSTNPPIGWAGERRRDELKRIAASKGHIQWWGMSTWPDADELGDFTRAVGADQLLPEQKRMLAMVLGRTRAFRHVKWEIHTEGFASEEERKAHDAEQARIQDRIWRLAALEASAAHKKLNEGEE